MSNKKKNSLIEKTVKKIVVSLSSRMLKTIADELLDTLEEKIPSLEKAAKATVTNPFDDMLVELLKFIVVEFRK